MSDERSLVHVSPRDGPVSLAEELPDYSVDRHDRLETVVEALDRGEVAGVVSAYDLPGSTTGLAVLEAVRARSSEIPVILWTTEPDGWVAADATRLGVTEYVVLSRDDSPAEHLRTRVLANLDTDTDPREPPGTKTDGRIEAAGADTDATSTSESATALFESVLEVARELGETRRTSDLAAVTTQLATDELGFPYATVRTYDSESDRLLVSSTVGDVDFVPTHEISLETDREALDAATRTLVESFETGEPQVSDRPPGAGDWPFDRVRHFPLGTGGTLTVALDATAAALEPAACARLLAELATANVERVQTLSLLNRYRTVFEAVNEKVFVLDREGMVVSVTQPLCEWLGYDCTEVLGQPAWEFTHGVNASRTDERYAWLRERSEEAAPITVDLIDAEGSRRPAEVDFSRLDFEDGFDGIVGVVRDISDLVETRAKLDRQRDRFSHLFQHIPDPVNDVEFRDGEPVVTAVNPAFESVFGYEESAIVGTSTNDILTPVMDREAASELDEQALEEGQVTAEVRRQTAGGLRQFLFRGFVYDDDPPQRAFGIYTDITEQYHRERRLQVLQRVLRHNLRNELSIVQGYADLVSERADPALGDHLNVIVERTQSLAKLSEKVRQIERIFEHADIDPDPLDLGGWIERHCEALGVDVETCVDHSVSVLADGRIEIALENLLENAIEHGSKRCHPWETADGSVEREEPTIRVVLEPCSDDPDEWATIRIIDDGPGIPEHERDVVTGDVDVTQLTHGSGLGLWLVAWVIQSLGGELAFEDREPRGTVVTIRLPRASHRPDPAQE